MESKKADEKPQQSKCIEKTIKCFKPLFKDKLINTSNRCTIYCNLALSVILAVLGVIIKATANNNTEFSIRYDDKCSSAAVCSFNFTVKETVTGPIYFYLEFSDFFLNHRNVMNSFSSKQLSGQDLDGSSLSSSCSGELYNSDFTFGNYYFNSGAQVVSSDVLNPCGIFPTLFPRDSFTIIGFDTQGQIKKNYSLDTSQIAYKGIVGNKYKVSDATRNKLWLNVEDPRFVEWMKPPVSSNFYKLWGILNDSLPGGTYQISIFNDARLSNTSIHKGIFMTNLGWLGGNNSLMYYTFFMSAIFVLVTAGALMYVEKLEKAEFEA